MQVRMLLSSFVTELNMNEISEDKGDIGEEGEAESTIILQTNVRQAELFCKVQEWENSESLMISIFLIAIYA